MPPRSIWSGAISFGLVNVPVKMYSAVHETNLRFHLVHAKDGGRIGYEKVCRKEGKPVEPDEIVKAYETEDGELVYLTDEDFAAAETHGYRTIDIEDFVPYDQIDPIYFEHTYYLGPADGAERVYSLLARAMERSGLAGIGRFVMRERQNLGCLRLRDGVIILEQMYFADEIRPVDEIAPKPAKVDKRELDMALELIDRFSGDFDPSKYHDTYRDALLEVIERKRKGAEVHAPAAQPSAPPDDLMAALMASLERGRSRDAGGRGQPPSGGRSSRRGGSRARGGRNGGSRTGGGDLGSLSRQELYERARDAGLPGRSDMTKEQLVDALARR